MFVPLLVMFTAEYTSVKFAGAVSVITDFIAVFMIHLRPNFPTETSHLIWSE